MSYPQMPGFRYLFQSGRSDAVIIYLPTEGVLGALGRKREVMVTKDNFSQCISQLTLGVPVWFLQSGIAQQIEKELEQWRFYGKPMNTSL